ncbi:hypothetical protein HMPREF9120_01308 [Neisseria sp. oral taxon 020 str. F0370]|nr:hypothetical protein HMPREF9120_01308 [Neisseria sp. oral taxon 020 str. F0370]
MVGLKNTAAADYSGWRHSYGFVFPPENRRNVKIVYNISPPILQEAPFFCHSAAAFYSRFHEEAV